jgi:lactoylglutathione lyase
MNLTINHIQHIGIPVTDLNLSENIKKKLGFENAMQSGFDFNGDKGKVAMMQRGTMIIEIYQMPEKELAEIRSRKNGHIDHIAFDVTDIEAEMKRLKNEGFVLLNEKPKPGADNKLVCFLHPKHTNGVLIELCMEMK